MNSIFRINRVIARRGGKKIRFDLEKNGVSGPFPGNPSATVLMNYVVYVYSRCNSLAARISLAPSFIHKALAYSVAPYNGGIIFFPLQVIDILLYNSSFNFLGSPEVGLYKSV